MISVRVRWSTKVTYNVFMSSRLLHNLELPAIGNIVVTMAAVFDASLIMLSISDLNRPFVSFVTMDLMSSA